MKPPTNPLSARLRSLRKDAGLSGAEAAKRAGMSPAKISRVETGTFMPTVEQVTTLCRVYKAPPDARREVIDMIRDLREATTSARVTLQRGGWQMQERIGRIEAASGLLRSFSSDTVIGLVQTENYVRAMMRGFLTGDDLERTVSARLERQRLLDTDREFRLVMSEGALRWNIGGGAVMAEQLDHLREESHRDNLQLGIVPWTTDTGLPGAHAFHLYDARAVIVGTMTATAVMTDQRDVSDYDETFTRIANIASYGDTARSILDRIATDYRSIG